MVLFCVISYSYTYMYLYVFDEFGRMGVPSNKKNQFFLIGLEKSYNQFVILKNHTINLIMINPLECFFGSKGHVALDGNPGLGYNTLLLLLIP